MGELKVLPTYRLFKDKSGLPIAKVGIRNIEMPLQTCGQNTVGKFSIYTDLPEKFKGVSMSLMQRSLFGNTESEAGFNLLKKIINTLLELNENESKSAYVKVSYKYKLNRTTPITNIIAPVFYKCVQEVRVVEGKEKLFLTVKVPYISTCSCSKSLCQELEKEGKKGTPHQQRALAEVTIEVSDEYDTQLLIDLIEKTVVTVPKPIMRRQDEQELARLSWNNTMLVEEAARAIALKLNKQNDIKDFVVVINHYESPHYHDAVAVMRRGIEGGLK